jgi:hypothetical protein
VRSCTASTINHALERELEYPGTGRADSSPTDSMLARSVRAIRCRISPGDIRDSRLQYQEIDGKPALLSDHGS